MNTANMNNLRNQFPKARFDIVGSKFNHDDTRYIHGTFGTEAKAREAANMTGGEYTGIAETGHRGHRVVWMQETAN